MKCYFLLREDLKYSINRLFKIAFSSSMKILNTLNDKNYNFNKEEYFKNPLFDTLMVYNMEFLEKLENKFIKNGIEFELIYENNVNVGILIFPTDDVFIKKNFFNDCITLEQYVEFRDLKV